MGPIPQKNRNPILYAPENGTKMWASPGTEWRSMPHNPALRVPGVLLLPQGAEGEEGVWEGVAPGTGPARPGTGRPVRLSQCPGGYQSVKTGEKGV